MPTIVYTLIGLGVIAGAGWGILYRRDLPAAALERAYAKGSRFIEVAGMRFHYRDEGGGQAILLLHGLSDNLFVWDAWAALLTKHFRVLRVDLPGHGLTGPDPASRYAWPEMAEVVVQFLDRLRVDRVILAGNSLGGAIAWQMAAHHPERVDRLILLAPVGYTGGGQLPLLLRLLAHPMSGPLLACLTPRSAFVNRVRSTFGDPARFDAEHAERQYRLFRRSGNRNALGEILQGGKTLETEAMLARIRTPTLILWGERDPVLPPSFSDRFGRDIDHARIAMIPDAGHAPMLEMPQLSAAELFSFLDVEEAAVPASVVTDGS